MTKAFKDVYEAAKKHKVSLRTAAYIVAIDRVAQATRLRVL
jgi:glutamate dehydrogenase/leucine dehydrogenase